MPSLSRKTRSVVAFLLAVPCSGPAALVGGFTNRFVSASELSSYLPIDGNCSGIQTFTLETSSADGDLLDAANDGFARLHRTATGSDTIGLTRSLGVIGAADAGQAIRIDAAFTAPNSRLITTWEIQLDGAGVGNQGKMTVDTFATGNASGGNTPLLLSTVALGSVNPQRTRTGPLSYTIRAGDVGKVAGLRFSHYDSTNQGGEGTRNLQVDAVTYATGPEEPPEELSPRWEQYVQARANGTEPTLPDFSYAGYHNGEDPIPTVSWTVFDVTAYGAVANDGVSDKAAIKAAISAAEANGSGIVFFPPGRFCINEPVTPWVNDPIIVRGSRIVFRGSGSGPGGSELYGERHMDPSDPAKIWSCPYMVQFKGYGDRPGTKSAVVANARRETFSVTVANAGIFSPGQWIQLTRSDSSPSAVAEAVAPYTVDPSWTTIINQGVKVEELHRITAINGNTLTFKEPIHANVTSTGNWSVVLFDALEEVGVEELAFVGNWTDNFVHHRSYLDDSGWSGLQFSHTVNAWIRNCRFTDWSACLSVGGSAAVTVSNLTLDGNKGHNALTFNNASHCLAVMIQDIANHHHACGVAGKCSGNVFWKSEYSPDTCFESHASQPRCTLFDNISGGWQYGRWGGAQQNQPNHLEYLVFWNYRNTGAGEPGDFKFMRPDSAYGRIIMPYVIGFHGNPQDFDLAQVAVMESNGIAVAPSSLYAAQYKLRTGKLFTELLYQEWAAGYGLTGPDGELTADPDGDLRVNLFEYGVGGHPAPGTNHPGEDIQFDWIDGSGFQGMEVVFRRRTRADPLGLVYAVDTTTDLATAPWPGTDAVQVATNGVDQELESVTARVASSGADAAYLRLKIELKE